jgi:23S rRNA (cytidine1920-2'-O)/16S rRNA (cytidine1409-2'-O)-methyltransferase
MRLDEALVNAGLASSRSRARDMIRRGAVAVDGAPADKPARRVAAGDRLTVSDPASRYVSRAALKLIAGLDAFGFDPAGRNALDLGASTGGFSQVLLERGAARVVALDVGHGQMEPALAADPRITLHEGQNARDLRAEHVVNLPIRALVADVSFISLKLALPPALALAEPAAWGVFLVKPRPCCARQERRRTRPCRADAGRPRNRSMAGERTGLAHHRPHAVPHPRRRRQYRIPARGTEG